jgi:hypothetical protein
VRSIIKDGKSEECLSSINDCTEKINDEIQRFISKNKDNLMSGMQDISSLAERYHSLADHSKGLQIIVQRMKRETADSFNLIKARTSELDRIHDASTLLNHVKRFVKAKAQFDQYLKNQDDNDLRSLASAAKIVAELEKLLMIPHIQGIQLIADNIPTIKNFGSNIRMLAQSKLLEAISEKNQAAMAHYLQVFFNLESLPEILLISVDQTVRMAAEASKDALQFDVLSSTYHDYVHKQGGTNSGGLLPSSAAKRNVSSSALSTAAATASTQNQAVTLSQLRIAMREITHAWSTVIFERATQILILQRVVAKKEDPITHIKFRDVLRERASHALSSNGNDGEDTISSASYLAQGQIVALFWQRLSVALHDICSEKLRHYPAEVVCRMYPYLRRAAQDVLGQMQQWSEEMPSSHSAVLLSSSSSAGSTMAFLNDGDWSIDQLLNMELPASPFQHDAAALETMWSSDAQVVGMFGSAMWHDDITRFRPAIRAASALANDIKPKSMGVNAEGALSTIGAVARVSASAKEADLMQGLQPIRDRFLLAVLDRMQHPIGQMFPDLDGYIAAIPSKRDLLTLIRAIQQEYVTVATESTDLSFISLLNREVVKTIRLMLTKMESMVVSNGADARRIATATTGSSSGSSGAGASAQNAVPTFVRTAPQEHNAQCFMLLVQFREALQKLPTQVIQHLDDSATTGTSVAESKDVIKTPLKTPSSVPESARKVTGGAGGATTTNSGGNSVFIEQVMRETSLAMDQACAELDELIMRQIVDPLLSLLTEYSLSILSQLQRESVITIPNQKNVTHKKDYAVAAMDMTIDNSLAVQSLVRQLPSLLKTYLFALPKIPGSNLLDRAGEELANRVLMLYISLASLSRPMTEAVRLRTAKDLSALEMLLTQQFPHLSSSNKHCPVMREFRAFRRLLFEEQLFSAKSGVTNTERKVAAVAMVPNRSKLLSLDYVGDLRPSTLMGLLMAAGPGQLPLPADLPAPHGRDITSYVLDLIQAANLPGNGAVHEAAVGFATVRSLYLPTAAMSAQHIHQVHSLGSNSNSSASIIWTWKKIQAEKSAWDMIQQCLDVFFQRLTVAEVADQKQEMRAWYEAIMDIGSHFFS